MPVRILLTAAPRFSCQETLPAVLEHHSGDLYVFPEGFLRSREDLALALRLTENRPGTVLAGYRDQDREKALVIEGGKVADESAKCILTQGERAKGKRPGSQIRCLNSSLGKLAVPICYELHFPEVCRIMALEAPVLMVNPIGTGMYHRRQYGQWTALARARAIENEVPVVGCCHFCGEIPLAFAFDSQGETVLQEEGACGTFEVELDLSGKRPIGYLRDRRPELFEALIAGGESMGEKEKIWYHS